MTSKNTEAWSVEANGLTPISLAERHGSPWSLFKMWIAPNMNFMVLLTGTYPIIFGLGIWDSLIAIIIGNLLGCAIQGLSSIHGPRMGSAGIVASRPTFGQLGAYLPTIFSTIGAIGWFSINSIVATMGLEKIANLVGINFPGLLWVCMAIVLVGETLLAVYGHATILKVEAQISVVLGIMFAGLFLFLLPGFNWSYVGSFQGTGLGHFGTILSAMGICFSYPVAWANFSSDYSRYLHPETSWKKISLASGLGQFVSLATVNMIGVFYAITIGSNLKDPISDLPSILPTWFLIPFLIAVIGGSIAANVPNCYTAAMGLLALRIPIQRVPAVIVISFLTMIIRIISLMIGQFFELYETFLLVTLVWTCPWVVLIVCDYFMRKGNYEIDELMPRTGAYDYGTSGVNWIAMGVFIFAIAASFLFTNNKLYSSPLMAPLNGADLSYFAACLLALVYYPLAKNLPTYAKAKKLQYTYGKDILVKDITVKEFSA